MYFMRRMVHTAPFALQRLRALALPAFRDYPPVVTAIFTFDFIVLDIPEFAKHAAIRGVQALHVQPAHRIRLRAERAIGI
jgi:hypothetical protein